MRSSLTHCIAKTKKQQKTKKSISPDHHYGIGKLLLLAKVTILFIDKTA